MSDFTWRFQRSIVGFLPVTCLATIFLTGCGTAPDSGTAASKSSAAATAHDDHDHDHGHDHDHDHPAEGPHHGQLIELGNDAYHAEIVHAEGGAVTVYMLDGRAKNAAPIAATEVTINLVHEGKAEQFKLPASPDTSDPDGKSSRFATQADDLGKGLDAEGSTARLVVTIDGKQYTGKIAHQHAGKHTH